MSNRKDILFNDHFQNFKKYNLHKAQLIIADVPYNLGNNAYASNPAWYQDGDNSNGERLREEEIKTHGFAKTEVSKIHPILF